jgi:hypothetical protein
MNLSKRIEDLQNSLTNFLYKKSIYTELIIKDLLKLYKRLNESNT